MLYIIYRANQLIDMHKYIYNFIDPIKINSKNITRLVASQMTFFKDQFNRQNFQPIIASPSNQGNGYNNFPRVFCICILRQKKLFL